MKRFIGAGVVFTYLLSILIYSEGPYTSYRLLYSLPYYFANEITANNPSFNSPPPGFKDANPPKIVQKRIPLTEKRKGLTEEYTLMHYGFKKVYMDSPKIIVVHWTAGGTLESVYTHFFHEAVPENSPYEKYGKVNVGSQFLVDKDGTIYQLFDETFIARHCIGMNHHAIGIENIGGANGIDDLTNAQLEANVSLIKYLTDKYPSIDLIIGHYEYRRYEGTHYFLELLPNYRTTKIDPGERFMEEIRKRL